MAVIIDPTLRIVKLEREHIPEILEIEKVSHASPWSERSFEHEVNHRHGVFLVALINGKVAGYGGSWVLIDEAHITNVVVRPDDRGKGLGRRLMDELLTQSSKMGALCSTLEVRQSNRVAQSLYEAMGYRAATVRKRYYPDNQEDAIVMFLDSLEPWRN
jgi:[ribosomal protein S18]-alanine N-acetyltransferase